jgi:hypothetical protein
MLERLAMDKHSSLLQKSANYGRKKFYRIIGLAPALIGHKHTIGLNLMKRSGLAYSLRDWWII